MVSIPFNSFQIFNNFIFVELLRQRFRCVSLCSSSIISFLCFKITIESPRRRLTNADLKKLRLTWSFLAETRLAVLDEFDKMYFKQGKLPSIAAKCDGVLPSLSQSSSLPPAVFRNCKQPSLLKMKISFSLLVCAPSKSSREKKLYSMIRSWMNWRPTICIL
jgi:hypothetical protein